MKPYISETDRKDEMVRIHAESMDLICMGFMHGNLEMPNNVVPLSKAIQRMDEYRKYECWKNLSPENLFFDVYGDSVGGDYRYSYKNGQTYIRPLSENGEGK